MIDAVVALSPVARALVGGVLGAMIGSHVATLVLRWPAGESAAHGRSCCDACRAPLGLRDLVPLVSYAWTRGRCRRCRAAIDPTHPLAEAAAAVIGALSLLAAPGWAGLAGAVFGWLLLALALLDARCFWLPDRLTGALALAGLAAGTAGLAPPLAARIEGGVGGFLLLAAVGLLYRLTRGRDGLGGGDPKLFGAIGLCLGWRALPFVLLVASAAGLGWTAWRAMRGARVDGATRVPLGTLLALAGWGMWLAVALGLEVAQP